MAECCICYDDITDGNRVVLHAHDASSQSCVDCLTRHIRGKLAEDPRVCYIRRCGHQITSTDLLANNISDNLIRVFERVVENYHEPNYGPDPVIYDPAWNTFCPKCKASLEHIGGCYHITHLGLHFCFFCRTLLADPDHKYELNDTTIDHFPNGKFAPCRLRQTLGAPRLPEFLIPPELLQEVLRPPRDVFVPAPPVPRNVRLLPRHEPRHEPQHEPRHEPRHAPRHEPLPGPPAPVYNLQGAEMALQRDMKSSDTIRKAITIMLYGTLFVPALQELLALFLFVWLAIMTFPVGFLITCFILSMKLVHLVAIPIWVALSFLAYKNRDRSLICYMYMLMLKTLKIYFYAVILPIFSGVHNIFYPIIWILVGHYYFAKGTLGLTYHFRALFAIVKVRVARLGVQHPILTSTWGSWTLAPLCKIVMLSHEATFQLLKASPNLPGPDWYREL